METAEKDLARKSWREAQRKKARRSVLHGGTSSNGPVLGSNQQRYDELGDPDLLPGQHEAQSRGADLAQLLQEKQSDHTAYFRSRKFLDDEASQTLPDAALRDADQVSSNLSEKWWKTSASVYDISVSATCCTFMALAIDFGALEDSLALLPLHELLGLEKGLLPCPTSSAANAGASTLTMEASSRAGSGREAAIRDSSNEEIRGSRLDDPKVSSPSRDGPEQPPEPARPLQQKDGMRARAPHSAKTTDTAAAERDFEDLMLSSPADDKTKDMPSLKSRAVMNAPALQQIKAASLLSTSQTPRTTEVAKPQIDDLEKWLDDL